MKLLTSIIVSVILAGTALVYLGSTKRIADQQAPAAELTVENLNSATLVADTTNRIPTDEATVTEARKEAGMSTSLEHFVQQLQSTKGKRLIETLESFWSICLSQHNCEDKLAELKQIMTPDYFELTKSYPELSLLWQQKLGTFIFESDDPLASRIAQFKQQAILVWGAWAEVLLSDQLAAYDLKLEQQNLTHESPEQYREAFEALLEKSQEHDLGLNTDVAKFEKAVSSLSNTMNEQQKSAYIDELERTYLSPTQRQDIRSREQQVTAQKNRLRDYHVELNQLESKLSQQRRTEYEGLTDAQWQTIHRQKITEFRRTFFSHQDGI